MALISTQVASARTPAARTSSDVGVLSDEEDVDDDERLHGTLTDRAARRRALGRRRGRPAAPARRARGRRVWVHGRVERQGLVARAAPLRVSESENDEPDALLAGTRDLRAAPGEPLAWSGPDNISASVEIDCAARDAVVDIALVASSSSYETTASHEVLAANRFPRVSAPEIFEHARYWPSTRLVTQRRSWARKQAAATTRPARHPPCGVS